MNKNAILVTFLSLAVAGAGETFLPACSASALGPAQDAAQPTIARRVGTIKAINEGMITLMPDSGSEIVATVQPTARILRIAPGEKDLKNAAPIQLQDLQVGDTIRVRGTAGDDGKSFAALEVLVITKSTVGAVRDDLRQDWQKRGLGGPVTAVEPAAGTVTITVSGLGGKKTIIVRTSKSTIIRRYASDSFKPEEAKLCTLQDVHVNDQLRARGNRSADGGELAAEEIFAGVFPQFPGMIKSLDASAGTLSVQDLVTKKTLQLKINADSQLHNIPLEKAQRFAMLLKGTMPTGTPGGAWNSRGGSAPSTGATAQSGATSSGKPQGPGAPGGGPPAGMRPGGGFDFQRLIDQTPATTLADLHKGDAVYVLTTEGTPSGGSTVITLASGVEPILQAAPTGSQALMLAPWNLGGAPGGDAGQQ
jgi:hypothetical protein